MNGLPKSPKLQLHITQEIIDAAQVRDSNHCMIAEAIKAARPEAKNISVDLATIRFTDPNKRVRFTYLTPRVAQVCLVNFDQARPAVPFSFQIRSGQVTRAGANRTQQLQRVMSESEKAKRSAGGHRLNQLMRNTKIVKRQTGHVADRVGGKTPPLQQTKDNVPFSRRRAYGLRALEY